MRCRGGLRAGAPARPQARRLAVGACRAPVEPPVRHPRRRGRPVGGVPVRRGEPARRRAPTRPSRAPRPPRGPTGWSAPAGRSCCSSTRSSRPPTGPRTAPARRVGWTTRSPTCTTCARAWCPAGAWCWPPRARPGTSPFHRRPRHRPPCRPRFHPPRRPRRLWRPPMQPPRADAPATPPAVELDKAPADRAVGQPVPAETPNERTVSDGSGPPPVPDASRAEEPALRPPRRSDRIDKAPVAVARAPLAPGRPLSPVRDWPVDPGPGDLEPTEPAVHRTRRQSRRRRAAHPRAPVRPRAPQRPAIALLRVVRHPHGRTHRRAGVRPASPAGPDRLRRRGHLHRRRRVPGRPDARQPTSGSATDRCAPSSSRTAAARFPGCTPRCGWMAGT